MPCRLGCERHTNQRKLMASNSFASLGEVQACLLSASPTSLGRQVAAESWSFSTGGRGQLQGLDQRMLYGWVDGCVGGPGNRI